MCTFTVSDSQVIYAGCQKAGQNYYFFSIRAKKRFVFLTVEGVFSALENTLRKMQLYACQGKDGLRQRGSCIMTCGSSASKKMSPSVANPRCS